MLSKNKKIDVIAISEALLQYDSQTKQPYVEIETSNQKFIRKDVELGISDGVNAELLSGLAKSDKIKGSAGDLELVKHKRKWFPR